MIALDSSALIEVVAEQPQAERCAQILSYAQFVISAATLAETLIVASRKSVLSELDELLQALDLSIEPIDAEFAEQTAEAYRLWGKGFHPAKLNYGDCFSYVLAAMYDCPLLYVGNDFSQTDIRSALA